jgi:hypothetical protein
MHNYSFNVFLNLYIPFRAGHWPTIMIKQITSLILFQESKLVNRGGRPEDKK